MMKDLVLGKDYQPFGVQKVKNRGGRSHMEVSGEKGEIPTKGDAFLVKRKEKRRRIIEEESVLWQLGEHDEGLEETCYGMEKFEYCIKV
ncbi:hypothetical protein RYX36_018851 [Vicia faba]